MGFRWKKCLIDVDFLENRLRKVTIRAYWINITENISNCSQSGSGALAIVNNFVLGKPVVLCV